MDSEAFKREVKPHLEAALNLEGGITEARKTFARSYHFVHFVAGMTMGLMFNSRRPGLVKADRLEFSFEEKRRVYDLVRLVLDSDSTTS